MILGFKFANFGSPTTNKVDESSTSGSTSDFHQFYPWMVIMKVFNTVFNPIAYGWRTKSFRNAIVGKIPFRRNSEISKISFLS